MHACMRTLPREKSETRKKKNSSVIEKQLSREKSNKQMKLTVGKLDFL